MARKTVRTTPKPQKSQRTTSKGKQPAGGRRASKIVANKGSARKGSPSKASPSQGLRFWPGSRAAGNRPPRPARAISSGLSLDRKLDMIGIVASLTGFLILLSLVSANNSTPTQSVLSTLSRAFGWGMYLFPIGLMLLGLWLVLRNFERIPQLVVERLFGLVLLYGNLLVSLHLLALPETRQATLELAAAGQGGGYVGGLLFELLRENLGLAGTAVALLAWLLIALGLALDASVADLFRWIPPLVIRMQDWWDERSTRIPPLSTQAGDKANLPMGRALAGDPQAELSPADLAGPASYPFPSAERRHEPVWVLPPIEKILDAGGEITYDDEMDRRRAHVIEETLASFGAPVNVVEINRGPTITQFGVEPDFIETRTGRMRVRVGKISALADDLALALSAKTIRVQAPVPGKGFVGIEVPNEQISLVALRDLIESDAFRRLKSSLRFALGQDVAGNAVAADLAGMPHLLIAGATGSGKSVCVNALICCLLINNTPDDMRLIMVDPKRVELTGYNGIPHLLAPVVVELERVIGALQWVTREMDQRYHKLAQIGSRNISEYNARVAAQGERKLSHLVVIIDELADLMMLAPDETERTITRLAQLARATGIHLVIATQRPSVDVVTGLIKANFPSRIAFAVASGVDSRVILDQPGAERLLGRGDMLFQAPDAAAPIRLQGAFVSEEEIQRLVYYWRGFSSTAVTQPTAAGGIVDALPAGVPLKQIPLWDEGESEEDADPLLNESIDLARRQGRASISMLQRRLRIGYTRAARLIETMQARGIIGSDAGPQGFEILDYGPAAPPVEERRD